MREWVPHALKPETPCKLSAKPFLECEGGVRLVVADFLCQIFVLEVRSWSDNDVLAILYQMNVILWSGKKG